MAKGNHEWLPAQKSGIGCDRKQVFSKTEMRVIH